MIELNNYLHGVQIATAMRSVFSSKAETVVSRSENGVLYGGVTFEAYTGTSVSMHIAGFVPNWITRELLWMGFAYPFFQLKCKILIGRVPSTNEKALKLDKHLGFKELVRIPDAVPDGDVVILTMRREECPWLSMKIKNMRVLQHNVSGDTNLVRLDNG